MPKTTPITYQHEKNNFISQYVIDENIKGTRPLVLVAPDFSGCNEFAIKKATRLAELGYVGFAMDLYGDGKVGKTKEEKMALMSPLINDRKLLLQRILQALETAKSLKEVDKNRIGAIGFCFGGLCVLDLARSGENIQGVVSFHGLFTPPKNPVKNIHAKVLALHGFIDPMVPPEEIIAFGKEMTEAKCDWQLHVYGNVMHGFTNPEANDPGFGTVYSKTADQRSWLTMKNFLAEIFA